MKRRGFIKGFFGGAVAVSAPTVRDLIIRDEKSEKDKKALASLREDVKRGETEKGKNMEFASSAVHPMYSAVILSPLELTEFLQA